MEYPFCSHHPLGFCQCFSGSITPDTMPNAQLDPLNGNLGHAWTATGGVHDGRPLFAA